MYHVYEEIVANKKHLGTTMEKYNNPFIYFCFDSRRLRKREQNYFTGLPFILHLYFLTPLLRHFKNYNGIENQRKSLVSKL